jgi:hypothetical protein
LAAATRVPAIKAALFIRVFGFLTLSGESGGEVGRFILGEVVQQIEFRLSGGSEVWAERFSGENSTRKSRIDKSQMQNLLNFIRI